MAACRRQNAVSLRVIGTTMAALGNRTSASLDLSLGLGQTSQQFALADALQVQVAVVVLAAKDDAGLRLSIRRRIHRL